MGSFARKARRAAQSDQRHARVKAQKALVKKMRADQARKERLRKMMPGLIEKSVEKAEEQLVEGTDLLEPPPAGDTAEKP